MVALRDLFRRCVWGVHPTNPIEIRVQKAEGAKQASYGDKTPKAKKLNIPNQQPPTP